MTETAPETAPKAEQEMQRDLVMKLFSAETDTYLRVVPAALSVLLPGKAPAWMKMEGLSVTAYVYEEEDGVALENFFGKGKTVKVHDQRDGDTWLFKMTLDAS